MFKPNYSQKTVLMSLHFYICFFQTQLDTKSYLFVYQTRHRQAKMPALLPISAFHMKVMAEKVIKTQCTFHRISLASVSLNSPVNKSEWQPGSLVAVCGFLPLCCFIFPPPPECVCHAHLHLDTLRKYWFQPSLTQLAAENIDVTQKVFDRQWRTGCGQAQH